jgi:hypothetical protein
VLPSFTYLHQQAKCITEEEEEAYSSNCWVVAATRLFTFYPLRLLTVMHKAITKIWIF